MRLDEINQSLDRQIRSLDLKLAIHQQARQQQTLKPALKRRVIPTILEETTPTEASKSSQTTITLATTPPTQPQTTAHNTNPMRHTKTNNQNRGNDAIHPQTYPEGPRTIIKEITQSPKQKHKTKPHTQCSPCQQHPKESPEQTQTHGPTTEEIL